jgi:hypothetical protein
VGPQYLVIERADGRVDSYPLDFVVDVVHVSQEEVLISGHKNGVSIDYVPFPLGPGDHFLEVTSQATQLPADASGATPAPTPVNRASPADGRKSASQKWIFVKSSCASANVFIDFYDYKDLQRLSPPCWGAGCAPYDQGSPAHTIDGHGSHNEQTGMVLSVEGWTATANGNKGLLMHEMGHVMGMGHKGPTWGRIGAINNGGIWDGPNYPGITPNEIYQARSHLTAHPSPAAVPCLGFPAQNRVVVSWFDTAIDDRSNRASVWRKDSSSPDWVNMQMTEMQQGAQGWPPAGPVNPPAERVTLVSNPRPDITAGSQWIARADVAGGPTNQNLVNWDPAIWTQAKTPAHGTMCTIAVRPTSVKGQVEISWVDGAYNETAFQIWYSTNTRHGVIPQGSWFHALDCAPNTTACLDDVSSGRFKLGDTLCVIGTAYSPLGTGHWSNVFCTGIYYWDDRDLDGFLNVVEEGEPLCDDAVNDDRMDDGFVNDGCDRVGDPETPAQCANNIDDDNDGFINDGCPKAGAFSEGQFKIGTSADRGCGAGNTPNPSDAWPADFVSGGIPDSTDRVTLGDLASFLGPVRRLNTSPGHPAFDQRWDLEPGAGSYPTWINITDLTGLLTHSPPMAPFLGQRAFNFKERCFDPPRG